MLDGGDEINKFVQNNPWMGGVVMAVVTSSLRIFYDQEETRLIRIIIESLLCGALTVTAGSAMMGMGYGPDWYLACGGTIGFAGTQSVRALAYNIINKKYGD